MRFLSTCARTLAVALHLLTSLHGPRATSRSNALESAFGGKPENVYSVLSLTGVDPPATCRDQVPRRTSTSDAVVDHDLPDLTFGTGCECGRSVHVSLKFEQLRQRVAPFVAAA